MPTEPNPTPPKNKESVDIAFPLREAFGFAWEMGYTMTIPLVAFALGGRLLDKYLNTSPTFLLIGIFISIIVSSVLLGLKATQIINRTCGLKALTEKDKNLNQK